MKKLSMILFLFIAIIGFVNKTYAQGEAAVPFLLIAPDSRAGGMGESAADLQTTLRLFSGTRPVSHS
jgi:hypothetical protein